MNSPDILLGDFIAAWNDGRRPSVDEYLARAGSRPEHEELAKLIGAWLEIAPTPDFGEATIRALASEPALKAALEQAQLAPLANRVATLRHRAGLAIGDVAQRLAGIFSLADIERTERYLDDLERGHFESARLSRRLLDGLAAIFRADPDELVVSRPAFTGGQALFRADDTAQPWLSTDIDVLSRAALTPAPDPMDELDRLFLGGPSA